MDIASEFIVMAATLLQIKSRMMLPKPPKVSDEPEEDPRKELIARILEYRRFKQVSSVLERGCRRLRKGPLPESLRIFQ